MPENGIPEELRYVVDENDVSEERTMSANGSLEELVLANEYIIYSHASKTEKGRSSHSRCSELDWPMTEGNIVNEFKTMG